MKTHTLILGLVACAVLAGNGVVLAQEFESGTQERGSGKMKKIDMDGDGQVSLDEFLAQAQKRFERMDVDESGFITASEYKEKRKAVRAKSRERRQSEEDQE